MAYKHDSEHDVTQDVTIEFFYVNTNWFFFSKDMFKNNIWDYATILKFITITSVNKTYKVEFVCLCREVIFNEILVISDAIFLFQ